LFAPDFEPQMCRGGAAEGHGWARVGLHRLRYRPFDGGSYAFVRGGDGSRGGSGWILPRIAFHVCTRGDSGYRSLSIAWRNSRARDSVSSSDGYEGAIAAIHDWFAAHVGGEAGFDGVGHRVVHGGSTYSQPVLIDSQVLAVLESLIPLAPLHQPHHIAVIRAISTITPKVPQVACASTGASPRIAAPGSLHGTVLFRGHGADDGKPV
jgi:Acetokinase family